MFLAPRPTLIPARFARTFKFVEPGPKGTPADADNRQTIHAMIQDAITKNLAAKGVTRTGGGGDVTVGYLVIVGNNASPLSINDHFGYGSDAAGLHEKAQSRGSDARPVRGGRKPVEPPTPQNL